MRAQVMTLTFEGAAVRVAGERFTVGSVRGAATGKTWTVHDSAYCFHVVQTFMSKAPALALASRLNQGDAA